MPESDRAQPADHHTRWPKRLGSAGVDAVTGDYRADISNTQLREE